MAIDRDSVRAFRMAAVGTVAEILDNRRDDIVLVLRSQANVGSLESVADTCRQH
jgi:hypothetical protein